jgi:hypothetical protein
MNEEILFSEKQRFNQWWLWLILIAGNGSVYLIVLIPFLSDTNQSDISGLLVASLLPVIFTVLFVFFKLETQIRRDGIYVRFFPIRFKFRHYKWNEISKAFVRKYNPIGEYGGWGIRGFGNNRALNVSGNMGLQLQFTNSRKLLIGTQKPDEITEILIKIGQNQPS